MLLHIEPLIERFIIWHSTFLGGVGIWTLSSLAISSAVQREQVPVAATVTKFSWHVSQRRVGAAQPKQPSWP
jgi:hypothetical protein